MDPTAEDLIGRLRRNPDDLGAYQALRAHYQRLGDYASLVNLLEGWARRARDGAAAGQAFFDAAELAWGALGDVPRGAALYEHALERSPGHDEAFARLLAIYEQAGDAQRLAALYERRAEGLAAAGGDPRAVAALHHRLGELWEQTFHRADRAIVHYRKAFELDPTLVPAIYAAREIYRQAGNTKAAAALLELEAKAEPDDERKVALLRELAHVRVESLGDPEGAVVALKRALGHVPGHPELLGDLAGLYLQRAERQADPQIAESDRRRAADVLFQLAQKLPPTDAVPVLERALDTTPEHEGALTLLERIAERVGHFELLPGRWVGYLARVPEGAASTERRKRLARAYLDAGQVDYAITCLEWVADEGDPEAVEQLVELYRRVGREQDALHLLQRAGAALPAPLRVAYLRSALETALARGEEDAAVGHAREILVVDPSDPEATAYLEERHRRKGEWVELRDLLLGAARVPGLSSEARKQRLLEVAQLCERRLADLDGAVSAWKQVATLDPADREARGALVRLLEQLERWDELVQALEREAAGTSDDAAKLEIYKRLARLHKDKRNDRAEAALAWRAALDVSPRDSEARDGWIEGLLAANALAQAVGPMRERATQTPSGPERAEAYRALARVLERLGNEEDPTDKRWSDAVEAWTRVLDDAPSDLEALDHLEALDRRIGDWERLLRTLAYRVDLEKGSAKLALLVRMGEVAERSLADLPRAAELYHRAFELDPKDERVIDALTSVYERTERYRDIVALLNEQAHRAEDPRARAGLYRRIARVLAERVHNEEGAAEAYLKVLEAGEDREALLFLEQRAEHRGAFEEAEQLLARIANIAESGVERRDRLARRADLLADALGRREDAVAVLSHIVRELDPTHLPSLGRLGDLAEESGDAPLLADTLERTLQVVDDPGLRGPIAERLARLYLGDLADPARAITALQAWHEADPFDAEPLRTMIPVLEAQERHRELVVALDALAELEGDPAEVSRLVRRAAAVCVQRLGDFEGARARLEARVRDGDDDAQAELVGYAAAAREGEALVTFFSRLAQEADDPAAQKRRWLEASSAADRLLGDARRAFELVLKALALDLDDAAVLDETDRLAAASRQYARLAQVYDTLLRKADAKERKVELLVRQAELLRRDPDEQGNALDRLLRAASLAPFDARVIAAAEEIAPRIGRAEELLVVHDRRKKEATSDADRVAELVASARIAETHLRDRERAVGFLAQAVALAVRTPALFDAVERQSAAVSPELARALVDVYGALAEDMETDPRGAAALLVRASRLLRTPPADDAGAYGAMLRAATLAPFDVGTLDALEALATELHKLEPLATQLGRLVEEALDGKSASTLLRRRAQVLERLGRLDQAAECWVRLRQLQPSDVEVRERLRATLRRAGKHDDLLMALENDLRALKDPASQLALRREVAQTWERNLRNRWEALEAWERVKKLAPEDPEAIEAIARLKQGGSGLLAAGGVEEAVVAATVDAALAAGSVTGPEEERAPDSVDDALDVSDATDLLDEDAGSGATSTAPTSTGPAALGETTFGETADTSGTGAPVEAPRASGGDLPAWHDETATTTSSPGLDLEADTGERRAPPELVPVGTRSSGAPPSTSRARDAETRQLAVAGVPELTGELDVGDLEGPGHDLDDALGDVAPRLAAAPEDVSSIVEELDDEVGDDAPVSLDSLDALVRSDEDAEPLDEVDEEVDEEIDEEVDEEIEEVIPPLAAQPAAASSLPPPPPRRGASVPPKPPPPPTRRR